MPPRKPPIKVLIADDQALQREGYRMVLEATEGIEVVGEAGDGDQSVDARHLDVHQHDIRRHPPQQGEQVGAVAGLADHLDPLGRLEHHPVALALQGLVVRDHHPDRRPAHAESRFTPWTPLS